MLKYLSLHSHFWDMGMYQNFLWNYDFFSLPNILVFSNHFRPILSLFAVFYHIFPYGEMLLIFQSLSLSISVFPLYAYARDALGREKAFMVVCLYCLFSPVWFINLSDFHPDSFIIPLALAAIYFINNGRFVFFFLMIIMLLTVKEISFFIVAFLGITIALRYNKPVVGFLLFIISMIGGFLVVDKLIPYFGGKTALEATGVSWLGTGMMSLMKNIVLNPQAIVAAMANYWKAIYIMILFGSFLFLPLLAPLELLPAFPGISLALLSDLWRHYALVYHYPSTVVPFIFIAFIEGYRRVKDSKRNILRGISAVFILFNLFYLGFFLFYKNDSYHFSRYVITDRDRKIQAAIETNVPQDTSASVSTSNLINCSHLANRKDYLEFPQGVLSPYEESRYADFVVLDMKRIDELENMVFSRGDKLTGKINKKYQQIEEGIEKIILHYDTVFEYDGFYIFRESMNHGNP
jgi:uncharacterized membrane protein